MNREILYERNITGSYMKIAVARAGAFDEKMLLRRKLPGLLPIERCYVNGVPQFWYNISGKQSLDNFCKMKEITMEFIERMLVSICDQAEILEWNLIDSNCLMLDPELIYVSNLTDEVIFTAYPGTDISLQKELQQLMEFLLTKINHHDEDLVSKAYELYEKTLDETYSLSDIREVIWDKKEKETSEVSYFELVKEEVHEEIQEEPMWNKLLNMILSWCKKTPKEIVYPEEKVYVEAEVHPTILLSEYERTKSRTLVYEGKDGYSDIEIGEEILRVGQGEDMEVRINHGTVSHYHARIGRDRQEYYVEDLNSTNGTFVNEEPVPYRHRRYLRENDVVRFAEVRFRFI